MFLELESVFNNPGLSVPFDYALTGFDGMLPLAAAPMIKGVVKNRTGIVTLEGSAEVRLDAQCDRCAAPFSYHARIPLEHTLVLSLNREDGGDLILLDSHRFSPDDLVWEDIVLAMPPKMLCRPECEGLCQRCGTNLNEGECGCKPEIDPRLSALLDYVPEDE